MDQGELMIFENIIVFAFEQVVTGSSFQSLCRWQPQSGVVIASSMFNPRYELWGTTVPTNKAFSVLIN